MSLRIYACESYYGGSHRSWLDSLSFFSSHSFRLFTLPARYWKWRMHGGALTLFNMLPEKKPDLFLVTDMIDISLFSSLVRRKFPGVPILAYYHENQLVYPWNSRDREKEAGRDQHYHFINIGGALSADYILFNSEYHRSTFLERIPSFFSRMPDFRPDVVEEISGKSSVLYPGGDTLALCSCERSYENRIPVIMWNHRHEYDKNPEGFEKCLGDLAARGMEFRLIITGEEGQQEHSSFTRIGQKYKKELIHSGYADSKQAYTNLLLQADFLPVFSNHDFFGYSVMEAASAGVIPLLPRRLSYPELYGFEPGIFYNDPSNVPLIISRFSPEKRRKTGTLLRSQAVSYSWDRLISRYDACFESLSHLL